MNANLSSHESIMKFRVKGNLVYAKLFWKESELDLFQIKIYDGDTYWSGRFSTEFAEMYRKSVNENKEEYIKNVKDCLVESPEKYTFNFTIAQSEPSTAIFSWHKTYLETIMIHGAVPMHIDDIIQSKEMVIDFLIQENKDLNQVVNEYTMKSDDLSIDLQKCKNELKQFINLKTSLEATLVGKFEQLLNSKKKRIHLFEENLENLESSTQVQIGDGE